MEVQRPLLDSFMAWCWAVGAACQVVRIITGSGSDDWIYWCFFTVTLSCNQIQRCRWFTHFPIHRSTHTRIVFTSCLLATYLHTGTITSNHYEVFSPFLLHSPWTADSPILCLQSSWFLTLLVCPKLYSESVLFPLVGQQFLEEFPSFMVGPFHLVEQGTSFIRGRRSFLTQTSSYIEGIFHSCCGLSSHAGISHCLFYHTHKICIALDSKNVICIVAAIWQSSQSHPVAVSIIVYLAVLSWFTNPLIIRYICEIIENLFFLTFLIHYVGILYVIMYFKELAWEFLLSLNDQLSIKDEFRMVIITLHVHICVWIET
jgi:hypothetical protein